MAQDEDVQVHNSGKGDKGGLPVIVRVPLFCAWLFYVQSMTFVCMILDYCGLGVTHALLSEHLMSLLKVKFRTATNSQPVMNDTVQPVVFLSNHRSFADFIVDSALLGGTCFLARRMVALGIPCCTLWGWARGWLWLFKRGGKHKEGTTSWMTKFFKESRAKYARKGVVVYPEGTRNAKPEGMPLKPGGLVAIYNLGWPVQVVITTNKENMMSEKTFELGFNFTLTTSVSETLSTKEYKTADDFIEAVNKAWVKTWKEAYGTSTTERQRGILTGALNRDGKLG